MVRAIRIVNGQFLRTAVVNLAFHIEKPLFVADLVVRRKPRTDAGAIFALW